MGNIFIVFIEPGIDRALIRFDLYKPADIQIPFILIIIKTLQSIFIDLIQLAKDLKSSDGNSCRISSHFIQSVILKDAITARSYFSEYTVSSLPLHQGAVSKYKLFHQAGLSVHDIESESLQILVKSFHTFGERVIQTMFVWRLSFIPCTEHL